MGRFKLAILAAFVSIFIAQPATAQFGKNKVRSNLNNVDWQVAHGDKTNLYYYKGGERVGAVAHASMEAAYDTLSGLFGIEPETRPQLIIYLPSHIEESNIYPGFIPENVAGFFEHIKDRIVIPFNGDYNWLRCVVRHEMVHRFQRAAHREFAREDWLNLNLGAQLPLAFTEGLAEYWAGRHETCRGINRETMLRDAIVSGNTPSVGQIFGYSGSSFFPYLYGFELQRYLGENYGDDKFVKLYRRAKDFTSFQKLFEEVYGVTYEDLNTAFWHHMRSKFLPQYASSTPPPNLFARDLFPDGRSVSTREIYTRGDTTFAIVYSAVDGYEKLYEMTVQLDTTQVEDKDPSDNEDQPSPYWFGDEVGPLLLQSDREGVQRFDQSIDVHNGQSMIVSVRDKRSDVLVSYDIQSREEVNRYRFDNIPVIQSPSWNPSGDKVVFSGSSFSQGNPSSGTFDLYVFDLETEKLTQLTDDVYLDSNPDWSPDGQ